VVGIVVVSHSPDLAHAAAHLALQMVHGSAPRIEIAAGTSDDDRLGTDAAQVADAIIAADDGDGVVVIMDLGSAVLSAELAIELLPEPRIPTRLAAAAFVEGIFAAVVSAAGGADLDAVAREAEAALAGKITQLDPTRTQPGAVAADRPDTAIVVQTEIVNQDGIHARPAALISGALAPLDVRVTIATQRSPSVSARSPTALMSLGTRVGDLLRIEADGPDASEGVDRILDLVRSGFGELESTASRIQAGDSSSQRDGLETPLGVSSGRVVGPALRMADPAIEPDPVIRIPEDERSSAITRLDGAAAQVAEQLRSRINAAGAVGELLEATAAMATDPDLLADASFRVRDQGLSPERAVWEAFGIAADTIRGAGPRQAERVTDLYDVRNRIISALVGRHGPDLPDPGHPYVLVAVDLAPADAAGLAATGCLAIITEKGGPTAHAAIIARSLGIPAVVGVPDASAIPDGTLLLVDGSTGELIIEPTIDQQATATARQAHRDGRSGPGRTADGHAVALLANVASAGDIAAALEFGAEGVGLYRTELCFLDRAEAPSVAEQVAAYRAVFAAFGGHRVVVRTLDAGSDKPLPFLAYGQEANPALGVRGFRTAVPYPEVLHDQLKAIKEAAEAESADVWVMAPMIATVDEVRNFGRAARTAGLPSIGVMIETPAAVMQAEQILAEVDFLSIGTNDLAQYTFAADRHSASLAALNDPWQPALLRMIDMVARAAAPSDKPVGVCGEAAADPLLALVLAGLGISSLSMAPAALAEVGSSLGAVTLKACQQAAYAACAADSPASARKALRGIIGS
jgi:multiphosphoryl transfer protein